MSVIESGALAAEGSGVELAPRLTVAAAHGDVARRTPERSLRRLALPSVSVLAAGSYLAVSQSSRLEPAQAAGLVAACGTAVPMLTALAWSARRPTNLLGPWLVLLGLGAPLICISFFAEPDRRLPDLPAAVMVGVFLYLFVALPSGRVSLWPDAVTLGSYTVGLVGPALLVTLAPAFPAQAAARARGPLLLAVAVAVAVEVIWRVRGATSWERRALAVAAPVELTLLAAFATAGIADVAGLAQTQVERFLHLALLAGLAFLPLAMLATLARGHVLAGRTLDRLLEEVSRRPSIAAWRSAVAGALDDPSVTLETYETARPFDGSRIRITAASRSSRLRIPIGRSAAPAAVLSVDRRAARDPELLHAVTVSTSLAVELNQLDRELRTSLGRVAAAGDSERRRIARDVHDSTQQRIVALRIHLGLARDSVDRPEERAMIETLGHEVDMVLAELRDVTQGMYPEVLGRYGVAAALRSASTRSACPVRVEDHGLRRQAEAVEHAVYFCCLEALQNTAKHAGTGASAVVRLAQVGDEVRFAVDDDGAGFEPDTMPAGRGLMNMADRLSAVGGTLAVDSAPSMGTHVRGRIAVA